MNTQKIFIHVTIKIDNSTPELNFMQIDCSQESELRKFAEHSIQERGAPDLMIIAAGYVSSTNLNLTSEEEMEKIFKMNFKLVALARKDEAAYNFSA